MIISEYIAYLKDNPNHYWFKRKLFGWGWTPATWEGWVVLLGYVILFGGFVLASEKQSPPRDVVFTFLLPILFFTVVFICVCYVKGEKPKWQWGIPPQNEQKS